MEPINMLILPRDDCHWQWECGECPETMRGFGTEDEARDDARHHWIIEHEEN
jgi:hypothetical protein